VSASQRRRRAVTRAGKATYKSPNRGLALLDEAIEQIELHSKAEDNGQWRQETYRCDSGMCLAGWVAQLAGGQWAFSAAHDRAEQLIADSEDDPEEVDKFHGVPCVDAHYRAMRLLAPDVTEEDCDTLFEGWKELPDIHAARDQIAAGEHFD
jgi:hypothetical protein